MVSSGGGGGGKPPTQPTPSGQITGYGAATPADPQFNSVLSNGMGWADVAEIDAASDRNVTAALQARAAAPPASAAASPMGNMDAFAQQLLDYRKQMQFNPLYAMQHAPAAQGPAQQLMLSMASGDPRSQLASMMGRYNSYGPGGMRGGR
jgi:hypothetical protein